MKFTKLVLLAAAACLAHGPAWANPVDGRVVNGGAVFNNQGNLLTITNTPGTIINWQDFTIRPGETTRFVQQGSSSAVLNRIVGQDPSQILGTLQSNGHVFLVNPNGIVFGAGAQVDVNGLVASTLNLTNEDFLAGRRIFDAGSGSAGSIRNQGAITTPAGGRVYLIAPDIENSGIITSPRGEIVLAAGHRVQLVDSASPDLHVVVSAPGDRAVNLGRILSAGGTIGIYGALVNQRGVASADSAVVGENGRIVFRASGETLLEGGSVTTARGAGEGGTIHILGDHVGLTGDARVDASGNTGGGTVLVGGDFHGADAATPNASAAYLGAQTSIRADAIESGAGGRVAVWSEGATRAYGQISAQGGAQSGDGGFAEVSSRGYLDYRARTDLRAPNGAAGTLLLDPNDITIQAAGATDVPSAAGPPLTYSAGPASSIITVADLQAQLGMGSVTIGTSGGVGGPNGGRITVADPLTWSNGFALSLNADNGIAINGAITALADGRLLLNNLGGTITQTAPINVTYLGITSLGDVTLTSVNRVSSLAAHIGDASHLNHNFTFVNGEALLVSSLNGLTGIAIDANAGPGGVISLTTTSGAITQSSGAILAANAVYAQGDSVILLDNNTASVVAGRLNGVPGSDGFSYTTPGALNAGTVAEFTGIDAGNANVWLTAAGAITGNVTAANLSATAGNGITLTTQAQSIAASNAGGSADINITNTGALVLQGITQNGSGAVVIDNTGALTVAAGQTVSSIAGSISLTAHSPLTVDGAVTSTGGGAITLAAGPSGSAADQLTVNGSISTSGTVLLRAGDAINVTGTVAGTLTQQAFLNAPAPPPPPTPPTLAQCIANPALAGCSAVLPTIAQCTTSPALAGCSVVLPTLAACVANPATAGCGAILPSLGACMATPSLAGCSVVLPSLNQCVGSPTTPGCSAVLPTVAQCAAAPALTGCSVVLPTLAQCVATPTLADCALVLPSVTQCSATPTLAGCTAVLPTLAQCIASPAIAGCGAILPTVAACTAAPTQPGCTAVLPALGVCIAAPSAPGCAVVLPSVAVCITSPTQAGCSAVLPTVAVCAVNPSTAGCSVVLPTLAACVAAPSTAGCGAVLPSFTVCVAAPATAGCGAVLPTLAHCMSIPASPGCSAVLPTLAQCTSSPTVMGCGAVLPSLVTCATDRSAPGCSVVAPPSQASSPQLSIQVQSVVAIINLVNVPNRTTTVAVVTSPSVKTDPRTDTPPADTNTDTPKTAKTDDKTDDKAKDKTDDKSSPGAKNEPIKKLYCN